MTIQPLITGLFRSRSTMKSAVRAMRKRVFLSSLPKTTSAESKKSRPNEKEGNQISSLIMNAQPNELSKLEIKQEEIHIKDEILPETQITTSTNTIKCGECDKIFDTRKSYIKHRGSVHVPSTFECDICNLKFKQMAAVRKHKIKVHLQLPPAIEAKPLINTTVNCNQCGKAFTTKRSYQKHKAVHAPKIYECDICNVKFKKRYMVDKHKNAVHGGAEPYICQYCDFRTHHRSYLTIHITRKHTDTYQFPCKKCDRKFRVKADYQKHMITHDGLPCICDICGISLPNKMSLYFHKHYNHRSKETSFPCPVCKKKLQSQKNLELHLQQHERRYICDECGLTLTRKCALKKHIRTHSGEKPHTCDICGRSFASSSGRKVHMLTHSGVRPYICTICGYSFTQRPALSVHWKKKHPDVTVPPPAAVPIKNIIDSMTRRCAKIKTE